MGVGGVGINLVAANNVFLYERPFNPAKEAQAVDRCHRIGQKRPVMVHRLVTKGSFEEEIDNILERKQKNADMAMCSGGNPLSRFTTQRLLDTFTYKPERRKRGSASSSSSSNTGSRAGAPTWARRGSRGWL